MAGFRAQNLRAKLRDLLFEQPVMVVQIAPGLVKNEKGAIQAEQQIVVLVRAHEQMARPWSRSGKYSERNACHEAGGVDNRLVDFGFRGK